MTAISDIVIPLATFFLGIIFTLGLNRYEQRETLRRHHIQEITKLINDWYNQLHEIASKINHNVDRDETEGLLSFYINNRLILPKVVFSLELIRRYRKCRKLVYEVEEFLNMVTNYREVSQKKLHESALRCTFVAIIRSEMPNVPDKYIDDFMDPTVLPNVIEFVVYKLDGQLQKVNLEGARALN